MTEEIFFFCQLDIVSETHFSCNTVDRGLWLAILSSLLCLETERNIRFDVSFLTSISELTVVLTLGKVEFLK